MAGVAKYWSDRLMPIWGIAVVLPVALVLAWVLFHTVEEPGRRLLRYRGPKTGT